MSPLIFHRDGWVMIGDARAFLLGNGSMVAIRTENAPGFGERINKRFRQDLSKRFRVLCLSRNPHSVLMWGHYTKSDQA
jgi:hypothetical protein